MIKMAVDASSVPRSEPTQKPRIGGAFYISQGPDQEAAGF